MEIDTLRHACEVFGIEYREGVTRLIDLAKVTGANYTDGYTLEQVLEQVELPSLTVKKATTESKEGELVIWNEEISFIDITTLKKPGEYLKIIKTALKGYSWYLAFGTALGLYRDKDFIKGDTDIDIAIIANEVDVKKIVKAFKGYKVVRTVKDDKREYQLCLQDKAGMIIDICFFYEDGEDYYTRAGGGQFRDRIEVIGTIGNKKTKYGMFPFPKNIERYLEGRYSDWKTPNYGATGSSKKICE